MLTLCREEKKNLFCKKILVTKKEKEDHKRATALQTHRQQYSDMLSGGTKALHKNLLLMTQCLKNVFGQCVGFYQNIMRADQPARVTVKRVCLEQSNSLG